MTGRSPKPLPSVGYLRECFDYDPKSGVLMWRERPRDHFEAERVWRAWNTQVAEKMAGYINRVSGRWCVGLNNTYYPISRVALKWMTGEEPPKTVDHHDGDYAVNNKWENLPGRPRIGSRFGTEGCRKTTRLVFVAFPEAGRDGRLR